MVIIIKLTCFWSRHSSFEPSSHWTWSGSLFLPEPCAPSSSWCCYTKDGYPRKKRSCAQPRWRTSSRPEDRTRKPPRESTASLFLALTLASPSHCWDGMCPVDSNSWKFWSMMTQKSTSTPVTPKASLMLFDMRKGTFSGTLRDLPFSKHTL